MCSTIKCTVSKDNYIYSHKEDTVIDNYTSDDTFKLMTENHQVAGMVKAMFFLNMIKARFCSISM
jgi:hypothetical protein